MESKKTIYYFTGLQEKSKESIFNDLKILDNILLKKIHSIMYPLSEKLSKTIKSHGVKISKRKDNIGIAHSIGCYFLLRNQEKFSRMILIDPSLDLDIIFKKTNPNLQKSINRLKKYELLLSKIKVPTLIIGAGKGGGEISKKYYDQIKNNKKEIRIFKESDHNFSSQGDRSKLVSEINSFIK